LRDAGQGEQAITLIAQTFRTANGVRGQLTFSRPDGELSVREVPGQNCREVESAMALIAAVTVDPLAASADRMKATPPEAARAVAPPHGPTWSLRLEQRLTARTAVAPGWAWGQGVGMTLNSEASRWRPSLGLSAQLAEATAEAPHGSADFEWLAGQLTACPAGFGPRRQWDVRACGLLQAGRLRGQGFRTVSPAQKSIAWGSAGVEVQARWQVLEPLWLGLEGGLTWPFSRQSFYIAPQATLHRVPARAVHLGLGAGIRFF
jgi:hypothetical protein